MAMEPKSRLTVEQCLDHHVFDNVRGTYPFISKRRAELDPHRASSLSPVKSSHRRGGAESKTRGKSLATAGVDLLSDSLSSSRGHKKNVRNHASRGECNRPVIVTLVPLLTCR